MSLPFVFMMILWPLACCAKGFLKGKGKQKKMLFCLRITSIHGDFECP